MMETINWIELLEQIANDECDGHFTIMKFTTNWKVLLGPQVQHREGISQMVTGETLNETIDKAITEHANKCADIASMEWENDS